MRLVHQRLLQLSGLLLLAGVAVGGVVWQERASNEADAAKLRADKVLTLGEVDAVKGVTLTTPSGETFALVRDGQGDNAWHFTQPFATLAEATSIDALVRAALDLRATKHVGANAQGERADDTAATDLGLFALAPARYTLQLDTHDGRSETLLVGKKNSFDGSLYVKRADAAVVSLVPGTFEYQVDKDLYKLREKRLVACDGEHVKNFTVVPDKGVAYTVERRDKGFWMKAPIDTAADDGQVSSIASALCGLRAKSFQRERPSRDELPRFGLAAPKYKIVLTEQDGRTHALRLGVLTVGSEAHHFAMPEGDGPVIELASDWAFKKLETPASALRDMHILAIDRDAVAGVSLYHGTDTLTFVKHHDDGSNIDTWRMTKPKDTPVHSTKVASLLYKLWNLKAERIVDEKPSPTAMHSRGLEAPDLKIELTGKKGESLGGVSFSAVFAEAGQGNQRYVTTDQAVRIDAVSDAVVDDIGTQASDYQEEAAAAN